MKIAQDTFEIKISWKEIKKLEETKQKLHDFLKSKDWKFCSIKESYYKDNQVIDFPVIKPSNSTFQFCIGNVDYPVQKFEEIKELLLQMIQCDDIENLEIQGIRLKKSKKEFRDFLNELGYGYDEGEWHILKQQ